MCLLAQVTYSQHELQIIICSDRHYRPHISAKWLTTIRKLVYHHTQMNQYEAAHCQSNNDAFVFDHKKKYLKCVF